MRRPPHIVGIAGASGSGKSTLAGALADALGDRCVTLAHDDYYRPLTEAQRAAVHTLDFDDPAALDSTLLARHLAALRRGEPAQVPVYAFDVHDRVGVRTVGPRDVIVVDGVLLLAVPELRAVLDVAVFVEAPLDVCLARRLARDVAERGRSPESVHAQWAATVLPAYDRHVAPCRAHAHRIVDGTRPLHEAVSALVAGIAAADAAAHAEGPR